MHLLATKDKIVAKAAVHMSTSRPHCPRIGGGSDGGRPWTSGKWNKQKHPILASYVVNFAATRQCHVLHALVETVTEGQALQAIGKRHIVHVLVELGTKGQAL